jgi:hypothetical protein
LVACSTAAADDDAATGDESNLTEGQLVTTNDPHVWTNGFSYDEFRAHQAQLGQNLPPALADDDPLTVRLQAWLDRIDTVVRADVKQRTGNDLAAPKPVAKILQSHQTFNAWVSSMLACAGSSFGASHQPGQLPYMTRSAISPWGGQCVHPQSWTTPDVVAFWNADKPDCQLSVGQSGAITARGQKCVVDPNATGGDDLALLATGQYIQFSTDLLQDIDEPTIAVVAAHELGHYYLGHTTELAESHFGYWYTRSDGQKTTPARDPNSADLEAAYKEVVSQGQPLGGPSFQGHYSARLRPFLLQGLAPILQERTEPDFACASARDALGAWTTEFQQSVAPSADTQKAYLDFESKLAACSQKLALGGDPNATSISAGSTLFAAAAHKPGPKTKVTLKIPDTLGAFLDRLDQSGRDLDAKAAKLVQRLKDNRVGLYTIEQAADEFALQITTKMGFTSDEVLAGWLDFMGAIDRLYARSYPPEQLAQIRQTEIDATTCKSMLDAGFLNADGSRMTMNMGDLAEPHHTSCYRLWNLWREAQAQKFAPGPKLDALTPEWATLKAEAAQLTSSAVE